jgi:hypothetical protein
MFDSWIGWLEEISTDINQEARIEELTRKKQDLKCAMCHLQYESARFYGLYSQATLALGKARYEYQVTEYQLACVDGRLSVYEAYEAEQVLNKNVKTMLSQMNSADRQRLLEELEGMEE